MPAISPTRAEDYNAWYQKLVESAELAEHSSVRGCMLIKPWGYSIWERIRALLDDRIVALGVENAYFPLLIPLKSLQKEGEHVAGFAKECAVVTHRKLAFDESGKLCPAAPLEEPLVIRPTSETVIGEAFARWISSYRDLPLRINQWANVFRWEMRPRLLLRTSEFLWQEGHTAHASWEEANEQIERVLELYISFAREILAIPVFIGEKSPDERFPGALQTHSLEAIMQDGKALQLATVHALGQGFAKGAGMVFHTPEGKIEHPWTTSWGVTTRLLGALCMVHGDDDGLVIPPAIAPLHLVILPTGNSYLSEVLTLGEEIRRELSSHTYKARSLLIKLDESPPSGARRWRWIKRGVPLILAIGARELQSGHFSLRRRDGAVHNCSRQTLATEVKVALDQLQESLAKRAQDYLDKLLYKAENYTQVEEIFAQGRGCVQCYMHLDPYEKQLPEQVSVRCLLREEKRSVCIRSGRSNAPSLLLAKSY